MNIKRQQSLVLTADIEQVQQTVLTRHCNSLSIINNSLGENLGHYDMIQKKFGHCETVAGQCSLASLFVTVQ